MLPQKKLIHYSKFQALKDSNKLLINALKRVIKENISKNPETLFDQESSIVSAFNTLSVSTSLFYAELQPEQQQKATEFFNKALPRLARAFQILGKRYVIPEENQFGFTIDGENLLNFEEDYHNITEEALIISESETENNSEIDPPNPETDPPVSLSNLPQSSLNQSYTNNSTMPMSEVERISLLKYASSIVPSFDGKYEDLDKVIAGISSLQIQITSAESVAVVLAGIKSRISDDRISRAVQNADSYESLKTSLRAAVAYPKPQFFVNQLLLIPLSMNNPTNTVDALREHANKIVKAYENQSPPMSAELAEKQVLQLVVEHLSKSAPSELVRNAMITQNFEDLNDVFQLLMRQKSAASVNLMARQNRQHQSNVIRPRRFNRGNQFVVRYGERRRPNFGNQNFASQRREPYYVNQNRNYLRSRVQNNFRGNSHHGRDNQNGNRRGGPKGQTRFQNQGN